MTAIFLSDVHLRDADSVKSKLVIRFLQEVGSKFQKIYILGDLFDVWPGTTAYLVRTFSPVVQTLKSLVDGGREVHYLEGNHDFYLGDYFQNEVGIKVHTEQIEEVWNGKRIHMEHGDLGNPDDKGYRALRYLLRRKTLHTAIRIIPQEWIFKIGIKSSQLSRSFQRKVPTPEAVIRDRYRKSAISMFESGADVVIMGHTHIPDDFKVEVNGRPCRYFNTGDWVKNFTYLEFDGTEFYTRTHPVKNL